MKTKLRKKRPDKPRHKITLVKFKDLPIGGLFYIRGWQRSKAIKTSDRHAHWKKYDKSSVAIKFRFGPEDKIKPVFYAGTKNIVVEEN